MKKYVSNRKKNKDIGRFGESAGVKCLKDAGYEILERNYRNRIGEIDIICEKDRVLHVVEVKTVFNTSENVFIRPEDHLDLKKIRKVIRVASLYSAEKNLSSDIKISIDGILIKLFQAGDKGDNQAFPRNVKKVTVTHIKNINAM